MVIQVVFRNKTEYYPPYLHIAKRHNSYVEFDIIAVPGLMLVEYNLLWFFFVGLLLRHRQEMEKIEKEIIRNLKTRSVSNAKAR